MKTIATHDLSFHADDVFAVAALELVWGETTIVRTRDVEKIASADAVIDVGCVYDEAANRFDHHQVGGAGIGKTGIPYASFGLVWKKFGTTICGSTELADIVEKRLVAPVDANDNGITISLPKNPELGDYSLASVIGSLNPTILEPEISADSIFPEAIAFAKKLIGREIMAAKVLLQAQQVFDKAVQASADPRLVVLEEEISRYTWQQFVKNYPELLFVVSPRGSAWALRAIRKDYFTFENRKDLPLAWAGLSDEALQQVTKVSDAKFCHAKRFLSTVASKEGALALAKLALEN